MSTKCIFASSKITADSGKVAFSRGPLIYCAEGPAKEPCKITLIPYYAWGNRGLNQMSIWIPEE